MTDVGLLLSYFVHSLERHRSLVILRPLPVQLTYPHRHVPRLLFLHVRRLEWPLNFHSSLSLSNQLAKWLLRVLRQATGVVDSRQHDHTQVWIVLCFTDLLGVVSRGVPGIQFRVRAVACRLCHFECVAEALVSHLSHHLNRVLRSWLEDCQLLRTVELLGCHQVQRNRFYSVSGAALRL